MEKLIVNPYGNELGVSESLYIYCDWTECQSSNCDIYNGCNT